MFLLCFPEAQLLRPFWQATHWPRQLAHGAPNSTTPEQSWGHLPSSGIATLAQSTAVYVISLLGGDPE
jgi:hypothetical protein